MFTTDSSVNDKPQSLQHKFYCLAALCLGLSLIYFLNPALWEKIAQLLSPKGVCYLTTPINAPMIDHIYLFNNADEIRALFDQAGFEVIQERTVISEKISPQQAEKLKVPVMYAAFIQKKKA